MDRVNEPDMPRSPRKRQRLEQRESQSTASASGPTVSGTSVQDRVDGFNAAGGQSPERNRAFTPTRHGSSMTHHRPPPSPTKTPPSEDRGYEGRQWVFDGIGTGFVLCPRIVLTRFTVSRDPAIAWQKLSWHPDVERLERLKDAYLTEYEPLHKQEVNRQIAVLERGGFLFDDEPQWDNDYQSD